MIILNRQQIFLARILLGEVPAIQIGLHLQKAFATLGKQHPRLDRRRMFHAELNGDKPLIGTR